MVFLYKFNFLCIIRNILYTSHISYKYNKLIYRGRIEKKKLIIIIIWKILKNKKNVWTFCRAVKACCSSSLQS